MAIKDAEIKVRVTKEQKELIKELAKANGMNMSEFIIVTTEKLIKKHQEKILFKNDIEQRAIRTDTKLQEIKEKMISRRERAKAKKKFIHWGKHSEG